MVKIVLPAVAVSVLAGSANADYVGSVFGLFNGSQVSSLDVAAGDSFSGVVVLDADPGTRSDFALFRLVFSVPNLEYASGWFTWSTPFTTGGIDDFSTPGHDESGVITAATLNDPFSPGSIDVAFENLSDSFGAFFTTGTILTFTLTVPETFELGSFTIEFAPDTFTDGVSLVDATAGSGLTVNVIPAPATGVLAGLGGLLIIRRRR